jgi:small subunit ribosomal protein S16
VSINKEDDFMVKIRLSRAGQKGRPFYHIVVADGRASRDGRSIERLGYYNPVAAGKDVTLELNVPKAEAWMKKGAQPTDKVKYLLKQAAKLKPAAA